MEKFENTKISVSQLPLNLTQNGIRVYVFYKFDGIIAVITDGERITSGWTYPPLTGLLLFQEPRVGMFGRFLGGVLAKGEFRMLIRNDLS